jgi:nitroreductase
MSICQIIQNRKSCRAYLEKEVPQEIIQSILETAKWAPSGVNHQPTQVAILGKETKTKLSNILIEKHSLGIKPNPDYCYCPKEWSDVYKKRRKECGFALYNSLSISIDDLQGRKKHWENNYRFFQAPVGLIIFIEKNMPIGSWLDAGMFIQNILLAAQEFGLATCPQAAFAEYPDVIREVLNLDNIDIICGIALGYEDATHPLNSYRTEREPIMNFTSWFT